MSHCITVSQLRSDSSHSLKRKRHSEKSPNPDTDDTAFTNAAFSSTPKKIVAKRRMPLTNEIFINNSCLEVKSISDIVKTKERKQSMPVDQSNSPSLSGSAALPQNPYEVLRKPPKKKKREVAIAEACFENPALNLELPEKQFNPYEVSREVPSIQSNVKQRNCFVNPALNLRIQDTSAARNPYEIQRCDIKSVPSKSVTKGVENLALEELTTVHSELKIRLPFKPNPSCRIDFSNIMLADLTPSKLLAEKLVFSPESLTGPKRSLDSIKEESSMDIGKELDRYQLELENSINEAKIRKSANSIPEKKPGDLKTLLLDVEQKVTFKQKLEEIVEEEEEGEDASSKAVENADIKKKLAITQQQEPNNNVAAKSVATMDEEEFLGQINQNDDVEYASESSDDDLDFKAPTTFVRAYQRHAATTFSSSKESLRSAGSNDSKEQHKQTLGKLIRKSIRKLMQPKQEDAVRCGNTAEKATTDDRNDHKTHNAAYKIIRNSLRRKPTNKHLLQPTSGPEMIAKAEISIIDTTERTMRLKTELLPSDRKHTLRSSLRRSTRDIGNQLMKTMFHKNHEAYELNS